MALAQRQVTVQEGPLYRTEGSHITLWCKVSGYQGPAEQNFQWSIYLPSAPEREVQIVSTVDPSFPYAIYTQRLQERDAGQYECHTPNTDERYFGSYSAKMNLVVIPDSLRVTAIPQTLNKVEHDSLELKCEVSKSTAQHSHVSIAWYRQRGSEVPVEIISLSRDFVLRAGSAYAQRQATGDVRLDKVGETTSKLTIYNLHPSDQGEFYCEAAEWIQDPDGSWYAMTRKRSQGAIINVQATDKEFSVRLETEKRMYIVGEPVEFRCILEAQNVPDRYFSISWAFNSSLIASLGPNAVPVLNNEFAQREALGQLKVAKESDNVFVLKIYRLRLEDSGKYNCRVTEREKTVTGDFIDKESKRPKNIPITVMPLKTSISLEIINNATNVLEGESLRFGCNVRSGLGPQSRLSVAWQLVDKLNRRSEIVRLDREGTLHPGPAYAERSSYGGIQVEQVRPGSFTLEIFNSIKADEGHYECRVAEWTRTLDGEWQMVGERHTSTPVSITALEAGFAVTAISRTPGVTYNESFDLQCIIKPHYPSWVPVDGAGVWSEAFNTFKTQESTLWSTPNLVNFFPVLMTHLSPCFSIPLAVTKLQVSKSKRSITLVENRPILLNCSVKSQTSPDSHFAVLWYVHKPSDADGKLILKTTHSSAFEYGTYAEEEGLRGRLQFERSASGGLFSLTVQRAEVRDSGSYYCHVEEWLLSPNHAWYKLAEEVSGRTEVTVKQPDNRLQVSQMHKNLTVLENEWVTLECLVKNRSSPSSQLAVEWSVVVLMISQHSPLDLCHPVISDPTLQVDTATANLTVQEKESFPLDCSILSRSSPESHFAVTWYSLRAKEAGDHTEQGEEEEEEEEREAVLSVGPDAIFSPEAGRWEGRLRFQRLSAVLFRLTVLQAGAADTGNYSCRVEEWLADPNGVWYRLAQEESGMVAVHVQDAGSTLQSVICSNDALFYFVFFYPFPIFGILIITILLVRFKSRNSSKNSEGKNGVPLLWIKEPHLNYSPTCLEPPVLSIHPGTMD
uniref:Immunoglobulin superfamily member 3 n=1 Tax=Zonotrichia albicollis TaxID=44394 RepID=A0A8D2N9K6_ZONAL